MRLHVLSASGVLFSTHLGQIAVTEQSTTLHWPATGLFPLKVVGARYYRADISRVAQNHGSKALVFCTATLILEDSNPHDVNAVLVKVGVEKVGHLSRDLAQDFRRQLISQSLAGQTTSCDAVITGGIEAPDRDYDYIIELDLELSAGPKSIQPTYAVVERRDPSCVVQSQDDGRHLVEVWLDEGVLGHMHKRKTIHSWTTDNWDTVNYYVLNSQGIGLGHKLFSIPKREHARLFGRSKPTARFYSLSGRTAVIELAAGA